jgi:hypothetical protein
LSLDGNAELLERRDVPADRPAVDPEPVGELSASDQRALLEQLQQLEQP